MSGRGHRRWLLALPLLWPAFCPSRLAADGTGQEAAWKETWYKTYMNGKLAGSMQISTRPREGGGSLGREMQKLRLRRDETSIEVEVYLATEEDAEGKLLGFRLEQKLSRQRIETTGKVEGGMLRLRETVPGAAARESAVPLHPEAVGPRRAEQIACGLLRDGPGGAKPGATAEAVVFVPDALKFSKQTTVIGPLEEIDAGGARRKLRRMTTTLEILPGYTITQWVDDDCEAVKLSLPILGMEIVQLRATREDVLAEKVSTPPEIFVASAVPVKGVVAAGAGEATYRLTLRQEPAAATRAGATPFRATGQDVVRVEDPRTHVVRVRRVLPQASAPRPVTPPPGQEDCLLATTYVQSDAEAIRNLAREVAGKEADSWRAAKLLERWVHENVTEKNLETAFATAIEVLQSREGDCTEHAVLLAALARAAGIPARVVAGLVYSQRAFVGHMWTEVYVGEWVPLDATLGKGAVGADHIALATSSLSSASLADLFLDLLQSLGNLQIEVLSSR